MNPFWFTDPEKPTRFKVNRFLAGIAEEDCRDIDDLLEHGAVLLQGLHGRIITVVLDQLFATYDEAYDYMQKNENKLIKKRPTRDSYVSLQFNDELTRSTISNLFV